MHWNAVKGVGMRAADIIMDSWQDINRLIGGRRFIFGRCRADVLFTDRKDTFQTAERVFTGFGQNLAERDPLERWPHHQPVCAASHNDIGQLLAPESRVDGQHGGAKVCACQKGLYPGQAVGKPDGNAILMANPKTGKVARQALCVGMQLGEADPPVAVNQCDLIWLPSRQLSQSLGEISWAVFHDVLFDIFIIRKMTIVLIYVL